MKHYKNQKSRTTGDGHIIDTERAHQNPSYQTSGDRQNMRQSRRSNTHNYRREDLGYLNRDRRGYDKQHKGNY